MPRLKESDFEILVNISHFNPKPVPVFTFFWTQTANRMSSELTNQFKSVPIELLNLRDIYPQMLNRIPPPSKQIKRKLLLLFLHFIF